MQHLRYYVLGPGGIDKISAGWDRQRTRALAQLVLNCPGSLVRRESQFMYCGICGSPLPDRSVFPHLYTECSDTGVEIKRLYKDKLGSVNNFTLKYSKLVSIAIDAEKLVLPSL